MLCNVCVTKTYGFTLTDLDCMWLVSESSAFRENSKNIQRTPISHHSYVYTLRYLIGTISYTYLDACYIWTKVTKCIREKMTLYCCGNLVPRVFPAVVGEPLNHIHQDTKSGHDQPKVSPIAFPYHFVSNTCLFSVHLD